jgi:thymidylate synthase
MIKRLVNLDSASKNPEENQYIQLIKDILQYGSLESGRNGETISIFGSAMYFSLENNSIPIFTSKKVAWKTCLKELLWFIKGDTNNQHLLDQKVNIWRENASRNFLDSRGLTNLQENDLGPVYGHQWRHFNAHYTNCDTDYSGQGVDQLQYIINQLKDPDPIKRNSRRLIMSAWNPCQIDEMALPPCHILVQFNVTHGNKLSCSLYQRSGDIGLGVPFNIASYSFLTHILAKHCGLEAYEFIYTIGNAHIYANHVDALKEQIQNELFVFPKIEIINSHENIDDYIVEDIVITDYKSNTTVSMKMTA